MPALDQASPGISQEGNGHAVFSCQGSREGHPTPDAVGDNLLREHRVSWFHERSSPSQGERSASSSREPGKAVINHEHVLTKAGLKAYGLGTWESSHYKPFSCFRTQLGTLAPVRV